MVIIIRQLFAIRTVDILNLSVLLASCRVVTVFDIFFFVTRIASPFSFVNFCFVAYCKIAGIIESILFKARFKPSI